MDKFVEKFNIFDLFVMLIPGIGISTLFGISLYFQFYSIWFSLGNEKYVVFFIFSYFCGVIFQEIGAICDEEYLYEEIYGGKPREIFLIEGEHKEILNENQFYQDVQYIKDFFVKRLKIKDDSKSVKELNSLIFGYCLDMAEKNNLAEKSEKMGVISEMSRSMFWGCIATIVLDLIMVLFFRNHCVFYMSEIVFLIGLAKIFLKRKKRYEKYRIRILLRAVYLYIKAKDLKIE